MADIICIAEATLNTKVNALGDIVDVVEDGKFTGGAADSFKIIHVEGMTATQVKAVLNAKVPKRRIAYSLPVANTWTFQRPIEKQLWQDGTDWKDLVNDPKFKVTAASLTKDDITKLADKNALIDKPAILSRCADNISTDAENTKTTIAVTEITVVK